MNINISVSGEAIVTINISKSDDESVESEQPAAEQRDSSLDALVIPADDHSAHELNAERRRDSYGYEGEDKTAAERAITKRQRIGFERC